MKRRKGPRPRTPRLNILIEPTNETWDIEGKVGGRVWSGLTPSGMRVRVLVMGVQVPAGADPSELTAVLKDRPVILQGGEGLESISYLDHDHDQAGGGPDGFGDPDGFDVLTN